jgi:simple sugar transport system permease protein
LQIAPLARISCLQPAPEARQKGGSMMRAVVVRLAPPLTALAAALVVSAIIVLASGADPLLAFSALVRGAFGGTDSVSEVAVKTCPLLLTGLAITVAFRAGVWNIGVEGQLLAGALAVAWLGTHLNGVPAALGIPLLLCAAAVAGAAWSAVAGLLKVYRNVNEILSTIMLNFIALGLVSYLVQGPLMESGGRYPQTDAIAPHLWMPRLVSPHRLHWGLGLGLLLAGLAQWLLYRSVAGYELRATGLNRDAARIAGIHVERYVLVGMLGSGALAGLAGGVEVSAITRRLYEHFSPGWGFTAIAVGLLGGLSPLGVVVAAVFFGALDAGSNAMQRVAGVSSVLVSVIQATILIFLVTLERHRWLPRAKSNAED